MFFPLHHDETKQNKKKTKLAQVIALKFKLFTHADPAVILNTTNKLMHNDTAIYPAAEAKTTSHV